MVHARQILDDPRPLPHRLQGHVAISPCLHGHQPVSDGDQRKPPHALHPLLTVRCRSRCRSHSCARSTTRTNYRRCTISASTGGSTHSSPGQPTPPPPSHAVFARPSSPLLPPPRILAQPASPHPLTPSLHSFSSTPLAQPTRTLGRRPLPYRRRRGPHRRRRFSRADGRPLHSRADTRVPRGQRRDICRGGGGACSAGGAEMSPRCRRDVAESLCPSSTRDTTFTWQPPSKYGR